MQCTALILFMCRSPIGVKSTDSITAAVRGPECAAQFVNRRRFARDTTVVSNSLAENSASSFILQVSVPGRSPFRLI